MLRSRLRASEATAFARFGEAMNVVHQPPKVEVDPAEAPLQAVSVPAAPPVRSPGSPEPQPDEPRPPEGGEREAKPRRSRAWIWAGAVVLLIAGGFALYERLTEEKPLPHSPAASQNEPLSQGEFRLSDAEMRALRIEEMGLHRFRAERVAEGRIAYNEDRWTPVFSPYNCRVVRAVAKL